jgi:hypothetical protein
VNNCLLFSHLTGGNLGALRSTAKNLGKKHDFVSTRIVLPYVCDYSKEVCHFEMYVCQTCGYRAHKSCYQQVPPTCSDEKVLVFSVLVIFSQKKPRLSSAIPSRN